MPAKKKRENNPSAGRDSIVEARARKKIDSLMKASPETFTNMREATTAVRLTEAKKFDAEAVKQGKAAAEKRAQVIKPDNTRTLKGKRK